jgi:hypothetical protein
VLSKDMIRDWLVEHGSEVRRLGHLREPPSGLVDSDFSRFIGPGDQKIKDMHLILLGSARANWLIREFQRRNADFLKCSNEWNGILVAHCTKKEQENIEDRILTLLKGSITREEVAKMVRPVKNGVLLSEDWRKVSFTLISRVPGTSGSTTSTIIAANQGRGIQAVCRDLLTEGSGKRILELEEQFDIQGPYPTAFQMVFAVSLTDQEARHSGLTPLLYRAYPGKDRRNDAPSPGAASRSTRESSENRSSRHKLQN